MSTLPDHLKYKKKRTEEEPKKVKSERDILKEDLAKMSDNRCKASLYHIIKNWEEL